MGLEFGSTGVDVAFAGYNGTSFVLEEAGGASRQTVAGISASNGQSYLIVLRIDAALGNDSITMYVNPTPGLASPSTAYSVTKTNLDLGNWTRFAIAGGRGTSVNNAFFDELRIGTSFADVSPALSVANVAPVITSNGGGNSATLNVAENSTAVTTIAASDANLPAPTITYSITGGDDQNLFAIDSATGELEFLAPPNYETPLDANHDNIYLVTVQVSDGSLFDSQAISIIVTNVNESPTTVTDEYWIGEDQSLAASVSNGWYDNAWNSRQRISLDNSSGATVTDQVILVQLNSSSIDYSRTQSAGQDLRFIDRDGTLLDYEIESWDEAGTSRVWVRVPQIDGFSSSDFVWMYYGNASAAAGQSVEDVWLRDATAIVHFGPTVTDSSPEVNPITVVEATNSTGYIGQSRSFDGVNDAISLGSDSEIDDLFTGGGTLSAWIRPEGWGENNYGRIASKASSTFTLSTLGDGWNFQVNGNDGSLLFEYGFSSSVGEWRTAAGSISLHQWQHVAVVYDSSSAANNPRIFIDGVEVSVTRSGSPSGTPTSDAVLPLRIGNQALTDDRTFDGLIDEFRAFSTSLTATQIQADYRSMTGTLISIGTPEEGPGGVLANDADPESQPLTAVLISGPSFASAFNFQNDGTFSYTPNANYFGDDIFVYSMTDGVHTSGPIQATIHVSSRPDAPIITSNGGGSTALVSITESNSFVTMVTSTDVDSPSVLYSMETSLDSSRFSIHATTGQLQFISAPSFASPTDSNGDNIYWVRVRVSDGGLYDEQLIAIHVNPLPIVVNHDPIGVVDNYTTFEDETLLVVLRGVLANDSDPDGDPVKAILSSTTSHGDLTLNADGSFTYLPDANYEGNDQFSYRVFDGNNYSDPTTVAIVVHAVNDAPLARDDFFVMLNDSRLLVDLPGVLANDSDVENDTLSTVVDVGPLHGTLWMSSNGKFQYEPEPGFSGVDRFTYIVNDNQGGSHTATVTLLVDFPLNTVLQRSAVDSTTPTDTTSSTTMVASTETSSEKTKATDAQDATVADTILSNLRGMANVVVSDLDSLHSGAQAPIAGQSSSVLDDHSLSTGQTRELKAHQEYVALSTSRSASILRTNRSNSIEDLQLGTTRFMVAYDQSLLWQDLASMQRNLGQSQSIDFIEIGSAAGATGAFTIGYVLWTLRSGWLVTTMLAQMPAWGFVNPLIVLDTLDEQDFDDKDGDENDSLESILDHRDSIDQPQPFGRELVAIQELENSASIKFNANFASLQESGLTLTQDASVEGPQT